MTELRLKKSTRILVFLSNYWILINVLWVISLIVVIITVVLWLYPAYLSLYYSLLVILILVLILPFLRILKSYSDNHLHEKIARDLLPSIRSEMRFVSISELVETLGIHHTLARKVLELLYFKFGLKSEISFIEKISKDIIALSEKLGGIITLTKAYLELNIPLEKLIVAFNHLERNKIVKKISEQMYDLRGVRKLSDEFIEILKFAEEKNGVLPLEDLIKRFNWPPEKIETSMLELEKMGIAIKDEDIGKVQWYFPGIYRRKAKSNK